MEQIQVCGVGDDGWDWPSDLADRNGTKGRTGAAADRNIRSRTGSGEGHGSNSGCDERTDGELQLAQDTELSYRGDTAAPEDYSRRSKTVLVDEGSGDAGIVTRTMKPTYRGALVVCQGGGQPEVKLAVTEAVAALTGLSADRITVAKWQ